MATLSNIGTAALAAREIINDPALPEVSRSIITLSKLEGPSRPGIGLRYLVKPLRFAVWARQNPVLAASVVAGTIGMIYYLGYSRGKRKRS